MTAQLRVGVGDDYPSTDASIQSSTASVVTCGASSALGLRREVNQDRVQTRSLALGALRGATLALVADGLGAYSASAEASTLANQTVVAELERDAATPSAQPNPRVGLLAAAQAANLALWHAAQTRGEPLRTTLTALLVTPPQAGRGAQIALAHIGDCRAYLIRAGQLVQLTRDHTVARDMRVMTRLFAPLGRPFGREWAPPRHILSRVLGANPIVRIDTLARDAQPGDRYLLCSDGVWGSLDTATVAALALAEADPQTLAERAVAAAQAADSPDDASVVVVSLATLW